MRGKVRKEEKRRANKFICWNSSAIHREEVREFRMLLKTLYKPFSMATLQNKPLLVLIEQSFVHLRLVMNHLLLMLNHTNLAVRILVDPPYSFLKPKNRERRV